MNKTKNGELKMSSSVSGLVDFLCSLSSVESKGHLPGDCEPQLRQTLNRIITTVQKLPPPNLSLFAVVIVLFF